MVGFFLVLVGGRIGYYSFGISYNELLHGVILVVSYVGPGVGVGPAGSLNSAYSMILSFPFL